MTVILYILIGALLLFVLYIIGVFIYTIYQLATGKMPEEEYQRNLRIYAEQKRKRKEKRKAMRKDIFSINSKPDGFDTFMYN